jgi:hypothetical protein
MIYPQSNYSNLILIWPTNQFQKHLKLKNIKLNHETYQ